MPGEWSPYFGKPTDEKDELWDQLYTGTSIPSLQFSWSRPNLISSQETGILLFAPEETRKMPNNTVAIPGPDGDSGIYDLEVFHELHCLVSSSSFALYTRH